MKKSLSLLVAIAMVFSMFATVVSAAEEPTAGEYLNELGVILGNQDGDLKEDQTWKRQDMIVLLSRLFGAEDEAKGAAKTHEFKDVTDKNYDGYISWAVEEGLTKGKSATVFGFGDELETRDFYAFILRALGQDVDYEEVDAVAVELGLAPEDTDFDDIPLRGETYVAIVGALKTEVEPGVTLEQKLGLVKVADAVSSASAVGVKKVEVKFNAPIDTAKATFSLKKGTAVVNISKTTFNEAKTAATLEVTVPLNGDYKVTVSGLGLAEGKDAASFTATEERVESISIDSNGYRTAQLANMNDVEVAVKLLNQYGEEVSAGVAGDVRPTANAGTGASYASGVVTIKDILSTVNSLTLTVVDLKFAKSATATVTVNLVKHVSEITLKTPEVEEGKSLESNKTGVILPFEAKDQYGNAVTALKAEHLTGANPPIVFITSPEISGVAIADSGKKLSFNIAAFNGPKKLFIQAIVAASGKSHKIEFDVNGAKSINTVSLIAPATQFGLGEQGFKVELQANDQYGNALTAQEIVDLAKMTGPEADRKLTINTGNSSVFTVGGLTKDGDKAVITLNSAGLVKGSGLLLVTVNGTVNNASQTITVVDAKEPNSFSLVTDVTKAVKDAELVVKAKFADQYGNEFKGNNNVVTVKVNNDDFGTGIAGNKTVQNLIDGVKFNATKHDASTVVTVELYNADRTRLLDSATVTLTAVKSDATLTYEVEDLGTLRAIAVTTGTDADAVNTPYAKTVKVVGKDSSGAKVALPASVLNNVTLADDKARVAKVVVDGVDVWKVVAVADKEGDSQINVHLLKPNADIVVQQANFKISKAAPVVASIAAKQNDSAVTKIAYSTPATAITLLTKNANLWFEVKDQYGVAADGAGNGPTVILYKTTPNNVVSTISGNSITFDANGKWKITATSGTQTVVVEVEVSGVAD